MEVASWMCDANKRSHADPWHLTKLQSRPLLKAAVHIAPLSSVLVLPCLLSG